MPDSFDNPSTRAGVIGILAFHQGYHAAQLPRRRSEDRDPRAGSGGVAVSFTHVDDHAGWRLTAETAR